MKYHPYFLILSLILFSACSTEPQPIEYGSDICHFCKMTIVDRQYAAEFVTKKGKCYKFDATECMILELEKWDSNKVALTLVTDFETPGKLIPANSATYLTSPKMPSPMGANLTAFAAHETAKKYHSEVNGDLEAWSSLIQNFNSP